MHFDRSLSTALVSALLVSSALGQYVHAIRSDGISARASVANGLGPDPGLKTCPDFAKYCSEPLRKRGVIGAPAAPAGQSPSASSVTQAQPTTKVDHVQPAQPAQPAQPVTKAPAKPTPETKGSKQPPVAKAPAGFDTVAMGTFASRTATENGLWTGGLGMCIGIVVTGAAGATGAVGMMAHLSLGADWTEMWKDWDLFATKIEKSGMTNLQGFMYTVDTNANSLDPADRQYMASMLKELESTYRSMKFQLQLRIGFGNPITVKTHPFSQTGVMQIDHTNKVTTRP